MDWIPINWFDEIDTPRRIRNCFRCFRIHRIQINGMFGTSRCRNKKKSARQCSVSACWLQRLTLCPWALTKETLHRLQGSATQRAFGWNGREALVPAEFSLVLLPGVISFQDTDGWGDGRRQRSRTAFCIILFKN